MAENENEISGVELQDSNIIDSKEQQIKNARAKLRNSFLNVLFKMSRKEVCLKMKETSENVKAIFHGSDYCFEQIAVSELQTAIGKEDNAIILSKDVVSLTFSL